MPKKRPLESGPDALLSYMKDVDKFASAIMQRLNANDRVKSKLELLVIGDSLDDNSGPWEHFRSLKCVCYVPGVQRDIFGREQAIAIPVDRATVCYNVPLFDAFKRVHKDVCDDFGIGLGDYGLTTHRMRAYSSSARRLRIVEDEDYDGPAAMF